MINVIGNIIGVNNAGAGSPNVKFTSMSVNFKNIQRIGTPVSISANPIGAAAVTEWFWAIRDSGHEDALGNFVDMSFSQNPTFNLANPGFYDIVLVAKNNVDTWKQTWRRAFFNFYPKFTEAQADVVIDLATAGSYFNNFGATARPGYKIGLKNSGTITTFNPYNLMGAAGFANHVRIQNLTDNIIINGTAGTPHPFRIEGDDANVNGGCRYIVFDFFNSDGTNGVTINGPSSTSAQVFRVFGGGFTDIYLMGANINSNNAINAAAVSAVPGVSANFNASTHRCNNLTMFRNRLTSPGDEGFYLGEYTDDPTGFGGIKPFKFDKTVVARNIIINAGRDAIQPGSCTKAAVHDNYADGFGVKTNTSHESFISWNPGTTGWCYKNFAVNGEMFANHQSGTTPWDVLGGETAPQNGSYFWGNVFCNGNYSTTNGSEVYANYIQTYQNSGLGTGPYNPVYFHNTIVTNKEVANLFAHFNSFIVNKLTYANNLIVKKSGGVNGNTDLGAKAEMNFENFSVAATMATTNVALNGEQTISGFPTNLSTVLLNGQTNATENGLWVTNPAGWTRSPLADTNAELQTLQVRVTGGTQANTYWYQTVANVNIGVTSVSFSKRIDGSVINNIVRADGSQADILFTNYISPTSSANDLTLSSFSSVAYTGSPTDIVARVPEINSYLLVDYFGYPLLAPSANYTFGAYSGYEKRTKLNDFDTAPATLSTPVNVTGINNFGFTVNYEANKEGYLYYVVVADAAPAPSQAQIIAGQNAAGTAAFASGRIIDAGTAGTSVVTGLSQGTAYDLYSVFVTKYNIRTDGVKVDVSTTADITAPTISGYSVPNGARNTIVATLSESGCVFNTGAGFSITGGRTVTGGSIIGTTLTLTLSSAFTQADFGAAITISYTAGGTPAIEDAAGNDLANIGSTSVTNGILAQAEENVVWGTFTNASATGNTVTASAATGSAKSSKYIPANSNGYIKIDNGANFQSNGSSILAGLIQEAASLVAGNTGPIIAPQTPSANIDFYTNGSYTSTFGGGVFNVTSTSRYMYTISRSANGGDDKIRIYGTNDNFASTTLLFTSAGTFTGDFRLGVVFQLSASGKQVINAIIQADKGLV